MKLQSISNSVFFSGFKDDLKMAKSILNQNQQLDSFTKSGSTVIIEKVEIKEDNSTNGKLKKAGEGIATTAVGGVTGGAVVRSANNVSGEKLNPQNDDVDGSEVDNHDSGDDVNLNDINLDEIDDSVLDDSESEMDDNISDNNDDVSDDSNSIPLSMAINALKFLGRVIE